MTAMSTTLMPTPDRRRTCRYLTHGRGGLERCTGEVVEPGAEIELCTAHLGRALAQLRRQAVHIAPRGR